MIRHFNAPPCAANGLFTGIGAASHAKWEADAEKEGAGSASITVSDFQ